MSLALTPDLAPTPPESVSLRPDALVLRWPEGSSTVISAAALRAACRCAPCRAAALRATSQDTRSIELTGAAPVGQYALQLLFSDGHDRGIYPWGLLRLLDS